MNFFITTLGCKVNQYESRALDTILRGRGHESSSVELADAYIINTCAVTAESARKSRQAIRRARTRNPSAAIAVCGCFSQISPSDVAVLEADLVYGSGDRLSFVADLERVVEEKIRLSNIDDPRTRREFEILPAGSVDGRTRAMLKIEDGCNNFCSYCVIPIARGRVRSLPLEDAVREAVQLQAQGYRELVITGIELSSYGRDLPDADLPTLIENLSKAAPKLRLRLGSLDPSVVTREFCQRLADAGNVCRHFHLSLQSGCDEILGSMRRRYDTRKFREAVDLLRETFYGCAVAADLIVGFPGETIEQNGETMRFIEECDFAAMHIFPYSPRPGTPAASMDGRLSRTEMTERVNEVTELADRMEAEFLASNIGAVLPVLFETENDGVWVGHSDNYILVCAEGEDLHGFVKNVKITAVSEKKLIGRIC